jgi:hypothetical protein
MKTTTLLFLFLIFNLTSALANESSSTGSVNYFDGRVQMPLKNEAFRKFRDEHSREDLEVKFENARLKALEITENLADDQTFRTGFFNQRRIEKTVRKLKELQIDFRLGRKDFRSCSKKTMAYVIKIMANKKFRKTVYLCQWALYQSEDFLTQILIHEASHLSFMANECQATTFEALAMFYSNGIKAFRSDYWKKCKTDRFVKNLNKRFQQPSEE